MVITFSTVVTFATFCWSFWNIYCLISLVYSLLMFYSFSFHTMILQWIIARKFFEVVIVVSLCVVYRLLTSIFQVVHTFPEHLENGRKKSGEYKWAHLNVCIITCMEHKHINIFDFTKRISIDTSVHRTNGITITKARRRHHFYSRICFTMECNCHKV